MLLRITALAAAASAMKPPSPAFRVTALAAVATATAPPFVTELRPAARRTQEECPVLTKIKKDDCGDVKDFEALSVCSDACLCKAVWKSHLRRVRPESPRRSPRHRRDACSMAW